MEETCRSVNDAIFAKRPHHSKATPQRHRLHVARLIRLASDSAAEQWASRASAAAPRGEGRPGPSGAASERSLRSPELPLAAPAVPLGLWRERGAGRRRRAENQPMTGVTARACSMLPHKAK